MVARDQLENSYMLKVKPVGSSIISMGMEGTPSQENSPNRARNILVKTRALRMPPCSRMNARALLMAGWSAG